METTDRLLDDLGVSPVAEASPVRKPVGTPHIVMANTVTPKPVSWLWRDHIPLGKVTLLPGDPGLGKSLVSLHFAATVSAGLSWPDGAEPSPPAGVVLLSAEDGIEDTIVPRLDAAGADRSRIGILESVEWYDPESHERTTKPFSLQQDISALEKAINEVPNTKLVIVDPISAYMGKTDSHKNTDVRAVLAPLAELAERTETAVLALQHLNKGTGPAIYRATGSLAFVAAARAVWCVVKDKDDPSIRLMLPIKCNLAPDTEGTSYKVVASPDNPDVPVLAWSTEPVRITADEAMGNDETGAVRAVADWLRDLLHEGPVAASEIQERAEGEGHAWRTVQRAKERLGVQAEKSGFKGGWEWKLPQERQ